LKKASNEEVVASARLNPVEWPLGSDVVTTDTRKGVQSVEHAFSLLQVFVQSEKPLAIKEIAESSGMPASKVHHYLVSLVRVGAVQQMANGAYCLGAFALHMGLAAVRRLEPVELAAAAASKLRDATGEAAFISVWGNYGPVSVRYFEGFQPVTVEIRVGNVLPLAISATGKVFVTWGADSQIAPVLSREKISTEQRAVIRSDTLQSGLGQVDGELLPRIASLAAPVFDHDGRLALVITQLGWSGEFDLAPDGKIARALTECAARLSVQLGYTGSAHQLR